MHACVFDTYDGTIYLFTLINFNNFNINMYMSYGYLNIYIIEYVDNLDVAALRSDILVFLTT
jgi:hypothetical protein